MTRYDFAMFPFAATFSLAHGELIVHRNEGTLKYSN